MEYLAVAALIAAAGAGCYALAQRQHIKHLDDTIAFERGQGRGAPSGDQRKQINNGSFADVRP